MKTASQAIVTTALVLICVPVTRAASDLVVTRIDAPPYMDAGEYPVPMSYTVQNQGDSWACPRNNLWTGDVVLLSRNDQPWDGDDLQIYPWGSTQFGWGCILGPGESYTSHPHFHAPTIWGRGDYYLIVVVDAGNYFIESNEENNFLPVPVRIRQSDLVVIDITAPAHVGVGEYFTYSWTVQNQGDGIAIGPSPDRVYLSYDDQVSSDDIYLQGNQVANVMPGTSYTVSRGGRIWGAGSYYLIAVADDSILATEDLGSVHESNEDNNVLSKLIRVGWWTPVVSTLPATDVTRKSATLNGSVTDDGGEACQYRFRYREEEGAYVYTPWTGSVTTGQSFSHAISDLKPNGMYYFSTQAKNSLYESTWAYEQIFIARPGEAPTASFTHEPQKPGPEDTVFFDASKSTDKDGWIDDYRWDFGNGAWGSTSSPSTSYPAPGEYLVRLVVTDNDGLVGTATSTVKVKDKDDVYDPWPPEAVEWKKNGHWYEVAIVGPDGISWPDAQAAAVAKGGHLATITSAEENDFIFDLTVKQGAWIYSAEWAIGPWLGGSDAANEGQWQWVTGEPWGYINWLAGQPDNWQDEDYLLYWGLGGIAPTWNDGKVAPSYVIEYELGMPVPVQWEQNGHWYQVIVGSELMSWGEAADAAAANGGYLATITSAEENDFVYGLTTSTPKAWIYSPQWAIGPWLGGSDAANEGEWQWVTGESWGYTNWLAGQPDNWGDEDYLLYWGDWDPASTWADGVLAPACVIEYDGDAPMGGAIIEIDP